MTLQQKIDGDFIEAYKAHDEMRVSVLRLLKSALKNAEISKKAELSENEVIAVIKKETKQRRETAEEYRKALQEEAAQKEEKEVEILSAYLPKQISEEELLLSERIRQIERLKIG